MSMYRSLVFCLLITFGSIYKVSAQSNEKDSLIAALNQLSDNKEKVLAMTNLSEWLWEEGDTSSISYARQAIKLAKKSGYISGIARAYDQLAQIEKGKNNYRGALQFFDSAAQYFEQSEERSNQGLIYNQMGIMELNLNNFEKSRAYFEQSLKIQKALKDTLRLANLYTNMGITYEMQGMHSTALDYYFQGLKMDELLEDSAGIAADYMAIGLILQKQKDYASAINYLQNALEIQQNLEDEYAVASVLVNLGILYKNQNQYDLALNAHHTALKTFEKLDMERGVMIAQHNLAVVHFHQGKLKQAVENVRASDSLAQKLENAPALINNQILLSRIYFNQGLLAKAIKEANLVIDEIKKVGLLSEYHEVTSLLTELYKANNQPDLALQMMQKSSVLHDSIYNLEKSRQIQELQTQYETQQKENQIALLGKEKALQESELKRKTLQQNMMLGGVALLVIVGFFSIRSFTYQQKQKRKLLDQQLKQEKMEAERLQELDEAKSRFFANIAHEFRTPLTLISGPSEQIIEKNSDQQTLENAQLIRQNADKLLSLVNQLLDLIKLESGLIRLQPVRTNFISFVKGCVYAFQSLAEEKDIQISVNSELEVLEMDFDKEKAAIIINNLVSNALKFTEPFGELIVSVHQNNDTVSLRISDTGVGIPEHQLPYIFDRFYQVDGSFTKKAPGTGIGLALVKELVELHQGDIQVASEMHQGTTFTITLPVKQPNSQHSYPELDHPAQDTQSWITQPAEHRHLSESLSIRDSEVERETILIVEDNPDVRRFIVSILGSLYHILEAENGMSGLKMTSENIPDLIISDVMMPEMDGYEFCRSVKEDDRTSHIPVIMLTAKAGLDSKVEGLETGADDYLAKPFSARELIARIKNLIKLRKDLHNKFNQTQDTSIFAEKENIFISNLKKVIDENMMKEDFNVVDLGKALAMSRTQVHRKLKALTNLSTSQFIRQYKLGKGRELLLAGDYNVSEVAYQLGFNTPNYFSTCFTEHFGYPPSEVGKKLPRE